MMTQIDNMLGARSQRQHQDLYNKSRIPLEDQRGKTVNGTGTVLTLFKKLGIPYKKANKKILNDEKESNTYYIPMRNFFFYLKAISKINDSKQTSLTLEALLHHKSLFDKMTDVNYKEWEFAQCLTQSNVR